MSRMANYWAAIGWEITLITFDDGGEPPFYPLDRRVCHRTLGFAKNSLHPLLGIWNNSVNIRRLRAATIESKPDVAIGFMDKVNVITLLATWGANIPTIVSERNDPAMCTIGRVWELLRKWTYPLSDCLVVQTERARNYFPIELQDRIHVIPNPVILPSDASIVVQRQLGRSLIAVGRLVPQKGFDLLLKAFAIVKDRYPEWTLTILGEGESRSQLVSLRQELNLEDRVHLPGKVQNPQELLKQADIFVMSSRYEGFPNALCEAMVCGLPVISTDCPNGPREIIRDGIDGILVLSEDVSALAEAMERLMSDPQARAALADRAPELATRFSLEKVMLMWESLIDRAIEEK
jgi:GalNAc-alpha-(1->4)-GalNAc-alpha-(1->3)-diNAcBac-PP-undecaprenol alpha-1,4-N-acetyl-D-galactosaminyltransferase